MATTNSVLINLLFLKVEYKFEKAVNKIQHHKCIQHRLHVTFMILH